MEAWLPVVGFEDAYEVSNEGRVRSVSRTIPVIRNGSVFMRRLKAKPLSPIGYSSGHLYVVLCRAGQDFHPQIHHLVLKAFVGPRPDGTNGLHRDDDPTNNLVSNLYWGTYSDNQYDKVRNGNHHNANKTHCPQGHEYTPENTKMVNGGKARRCATCERKHGLEAYYRSKSR